MDINGIQWRKLQLCLCTRSTTALILPDSAKPRRNPPRGNFSIPDFLKFKAKKQKFENRIKRNRIVDSMSSAMVQLRPLVGTILIALCVLVPPVSAESIDFRYCDKNTEYEVRVRGVDIFPYPIHRGIETTFTIFASTDKEIPGGRLEIDVSYLGFHVHNENHGLCEQMSCPVPVGVFVLSDSLKLPGIIPPGLYTLRMAIEDEDKKQLTCITFGFPVDFWAPEALANF